MDTYLRPYITEIFGQDVSLCINTESDSQNNSNGDDKFDIVADYIHAQKLACSGINFDILVWCYFDWMQTGESEVKLWPDVIDYFIFTYNS